MLQFMSYGTETSMVYFINAARVTGVRGELDAEGVLTQEWCEIATIDCRLWRVRGGAADAQLRVAKEMMA